MSGSRLGILKTLLAVRVGKAVMDNEAFVIVSSWLGGHGSCCLDQRVKLGR